MTREELEQVASCAAELVRAAPAPARAAGAIVGAVMGAIGSLYGDEKAAEMLYAMADATATRSRQEGRR